MQNCLHLLVLFLLSTVQIDSVSIEELLQTNQAILLVQSGDITFAETQVNVSCPAFATVPQYKHDIGKVWIHLIRDPAEVYSPRLLLLRHIVHGINIKITSLNTTKLFDSSYDSLTELVDFQNVRSGDITHFPRYQLDFSTLKYTLFDSIDRVLYMLFYTRTEIIVVNVFFLYTPEQRYAFFYQNEERFNRSAAPDRFDWVEDPYAQKFYYKEVIGNETQLFEVPMRHPGRVINGAKAGKLVDVIENSGDLLGISGDVRLSVNRTGDERKTVVFFESQKAADLLKCFAARGSAIEQAKRFLVIRNNDYCHLRDGENYNKTLCEKEQRQYLISKGIIPGPDDELSIISWLVIICIVLFSLVLLLCVYIYWLRSTFVSEEEKTQQNDFESEASLFVAKQRSFPSSYPDHGLLDVSVDRWN